MTTAPQHPSVRPADRPSDHSPDHPTDHEGLTVPELLDVLDGRPPLREPVRRRPPAVVAGARGVASAVRRTAPPAAAAVSAAAVSAAATAGTVTARGVRTAWRTYEAWPRRVEPGRRPGTGPGRLR